MSAHSTVSGRMQHVLSVLTAFIDNQRHGEPERDATSLGVLARSEQRCTACGYWIVVNDVIVPASRPRVHVTGLWVHAVCPTDHYERLLWLTRRRGADLLERVQELALPQNCARCGHTSREGELFALIRLPGTNLRDARSHSWICLECYRP